MRLYYPIQILGPRFQMDHISPKKIGLFEKYDKNPVKTDLDIISIKHRAI